MTHKPDNPRVHPLRPNCYNTCMSQNNTGTYVYDKKLGKVVKVSARVPGVSGAAKAAVGAPGCNGCCGGCGCHED